MKVLIWIFCFICAAIVNSLCKNWDAISSLAISLSDNFDEFVLWSSTLYGACTAAIYFVAFYSSIKLSKLYTQHHFDKQVQKSGLSAFQYVRSITSKDIIEYCENNLHKSAPEITQYLENQVKLGKLKRTYADVLIRVYSSNCGRQTVESCPTPCATSVSLQEEPIEPQCDETATLCSSEFGAHLRELRLSVGISQAALAENVHVLPATISRYEQGQREPDISTLRDLAQCLGVDMNNLLCYPNEPHAQFDLQRKFNALDDRGKSIVLNVLEHEYAQIPK